MLKHVTMVGYVQAHSKLHKQESSNRRDDCHSCAQRWHSSSRPIIIVITNEEAIGSPSIARRGVTEESAIPHGLLVRRSGDGRNGDGRNGKGRNGDGGK